MADGVIRRDYARTEAILRRQDEFVARARRVLREHGQSARARRRLRAMARACSEDCEAIAATYETAAYRD